MAATVIRHGLLCATWNFTSHLSGGFKNRHKKSSQSSIFNQSRQPIKATNYGGTFSTPRSKRSHSNEHHWPFLSNFLWWCLDSRILTPPARYHRVQVFVDTDCMPPSSGLLPKMWEEDKNRFFESFLVCKQATTILVLFKNGSEKGSTSVFSYSLYNKLSIECTFTVNTAETFVQE